MKRLHALGCFLLCSFFPFSIVAMEAGISKNALSSEPIVQKLKDKGLATLLSVEGFRSSMQRLHALTRNSDIHHPHEQLEAMISYDQFSALCEQYIKATKLTFSSPLDWIFCEGFRVEGEQKNNLDGKNSFFTYIQKIEMDEWVNPAYDSHKKHVYCVGDLHGAIHGLTEFLCFMNTPIGKEKKSVMHGYTISDPEDYVVFLGDYTGRGVYGVEVLGELMKLKLANPHNVIVLRGNHELLRRDTLVACLKKSHKTFVAGEFELCDEVQIKYPQKRLEMLACLDSIFDTMPIALLLAGRLEGQRTSCLVCHAGGDEQYRNELPRLLRCLYARFDLLKYDKRRDCGFCYSDFDMCASKAHMQKPMFNAVRNSGWIYAKKSWDRYCEKANIFFLVRGHQHFGKMAQLFNYGYRGDPDLCGVNILWSQHSPVCTLCCSYDCTAGRPCNHQYNNVVMVQYDLLKGFDGRAFLKVPSATDISLVAHRER